MKQKSPNLDIEKSKRGGNPLEAFWRHRCGNPFKAPKNQYMREYVIF